MAVTGLTVDVSYDDGATWAKAEVAGGGQNLRATVRHPGRAGHASLRAVAVDAAGNRVEQTIIRAYAPH